jgi:hypothetical protein
MLSSALVVDAIPTAILDLALRNLSLLAWDRYTRRCCDRVARVTRSHGLVPSAHVCLWHKADITAVLSDVGFRG